MPRPWTVNKARRLEAVNACEQMASSNDQFGIGPAYGVASNVHVKTPIAVLAQAAFDAVFYYQDLYGTIREMWAEAACLLEMGWTPGDTLILKSTQLEEKLDAQVDAKSAAMDAAGVPVDAENVQLEEDETVIVDAYPDVPDTEDVHEIDLSTVQAGEAMRDLSDEEKAEVSAAFKGIDRGVAEENLAGTKLSEFANYYGDTTGDTGE